MEPKVHYLWNGRLFASEGANMNDNRQSSVNVGGHIMIHILSILPIRSVLQPTVQFRL